MSKRFTAGGKGARKGGLAGAGSRSSRLSGRAGAHRIVAESLWRPRVINRRADEKRPGFVFTPQQTPSVAERVPPFAVIR
jgi:hypothetical protein